MISLVSVNFITDGVPANRYPIVLFYNGDCTAAGIFSAIAGNEELSQYIYSNFITVQAYAKTHVYVVSYSADDVAADTEEKTAKYECTVEDILPLDRADILAKLLSEVLSELAGGMEGTVQEITAALARHGVTEATVTNFARHKAQLAGISKRNAAEMARAVQEAFPKTQAMN